MHDEETLKHFPDLPKGVVPEWYLYGRVPLVGALAVAALMWPDFSVLGDIVILRSSLDNLPSWRHKVATNPTEVESVLNHRHILDLFTDDQVTNDQVLVFGRLLKNTWAAKLHLDFPDRNFIVDFPENFDLRFDNPSISFWQMRTSPTGDRAT